MQSYTIKTSKLIVYLNMNHSERIALVSEMNLTEAVLKKEKSWSSSKKTLFSREVIKNI